MLQPASQMTWSRGATTSTPLWTAARVDTQHGGGQAGARPRTARSSFAHRLDRRRRQVRPGGAQDSPRAVKPSTAPNSRAKAAIDPERQPCDRAYEGHSGD